ncbi:dynein regulatory complex protein 1-like [Thalassophryne amazonica]|uniref:dynein regulatory complex protein 1-like n=1 Tax=Thalassophryne amazonica TaxID=390379 RepID=UPI00147128E4|nr:dynein regulatory complex protein 1-like [Thalassophryne amazonica]
MNEYYVSQQGAFGAAELSENEEQTFAAPHVSAAAKTHNESFIAQEKKADSCRKECRRSRPLVEESEKRMLRLYQDLVTSVTDIQSTAEAKESQRRTDLEEARRLRLERLENHLKTSQEKFDEISRGWSIAKMKIIPQELQDALNSQQLLCAELKDDKKQRINDLQQEVKTGDDYYIRDLKKQAEEINLMTEKMNHQIKTLTKAYREELAKTEGRHQQENELLLQINTQDWNESLEKFRDTEVKKLKQRRENVEACEVSLNALRVENTEKYNIRKSTDNAVLENLQLKIQQKKVTSLVTKTKNKLREKEKEDHAISLTQLKSRIFSLQDELEDLRVKYSNQLKQVKKGNQNLVKDYSRCHQQYEHLQKKMKHFATVEAKTFEEMWLMIELEVKQLVDRALDIDSLIYKSQLGVAWERPHMGFMEVSGPVECQKWAQRPAYHAMSQLFKTSQGKVDASDERRLEMDDTESTAVEGQSDNCTGKENLSVKVMKKLLEMLSDETDFLVDDKLMKLLSLQPKDEQILHKLDSIFVALGIEDVDVYQLADFFIKYQHQQTLKLGEASVETQKVEPSSSNHVTTDLIHPDNILPALKIFIEQHIKSRESSTACRHMLWHVDIRDQSYWESMANIIPEDKVQLWDAVEERLKKYHVVLTENCELLQEIKHLKQQNTELRLLLQQTLSIVS